MGVPANTKQVFTEDEFLLFMELFNELSQSGTQLVKYPELCTKWNREVVARMRSLAATENPATVFEQVRFKTKNELKVYATKAALHHTASHAHDCHLQVAARFHGISALKPFHQMYRDMRRSLKKRSAVVAAFANPAPSALSVPTVIQAEHVGADDTGIHTARPPPHRNRRHKTHPSGSPNQIPSGS